jgi:hypothetical protein
MLVLVTLSMLVPVALSALVPVALSAPAPWAAAPEVQHPTPRQESVGLRGG